MSGKSSKEERIPRFADIEGEMLAILRPPDSRRILFLDTKGQWSGNPQGLRDRICHSLFHHLRSWSGQEATTLLARAFSPLLAEPLWLVARKMAAARHIVQESPVLILLEALLWTVEREAWKVNAESPAPEWNIDARRFQAESRKALRALEEDLASVLSPNERELLLRAADNIKTEAASLVVPLARLIAEEERIFFRLEELTDPSLSREGREEAAARLLEMIQPPLGIVTQVPPAFFLPCLRLLLDRRIDPASGIPYMASLILSVFQDERSAESLLSAFEFFPLNFTKIRENLIYTLGNLKEDRAVDPLVSVLQAPDEITRDASGQPTACLLLEQKEEAVWALGKIGLAAVKAIPILASYAEHPSSKLKTYLAWTLGEVGRAQKEATGGLSADIIIALLRLLKDRSRQIFEEAVNALKKIQMPEFIHSLYLYHVGAISILGLKPAQRGLYELSETLHHLLHTKRTTIMAVNGDSGTGKTYFCQAIAAGFAGIQADEILYLMRDSKRGQKVFNRILGLPWLRDHIDPCYYQDDPVSEAEDDPEAYFRHFLEENADKRLIILDGCRDRHYFQRVIDFLYLQGALDVEVNFRADFSTRRRNLETREAALESVKLHLQFLEEPALEDTSFYQDGLVMLYDLDNSLASRLDAEETRELFERPRVDAWGELIRLGDFPGEKQNRPCRKESSSLNEEELAISEESWPAERTSPFIPEERKLKPTLNQNLEAEPNLLETFSLNDLRPERLHFYAQDQVAGQGEAGAVFVLTFLDNRIFQTPIKGSADLTLLGRTFFLAVPGRGLLRLSFERNELTEWPAGDPFPLKVVSSPPDRLVAAYKDGTIRVWDFLEKRVIRFPGQWPLVSALGVDQRGRIYGGSETGELKQWDLEKKRARTFAIPAGPIRFIRRYPSGRLLTVEEGGQEAGPVLLRIFDPDSAAIKSIPVPSGLTVNGISVYLDGRVIAGCSLAPGRSEGRGKSLIILSPGSDDCSFLALSGHGKETKDCLVMGPKIVTAGADPDGRTSIRIWGTAFFVQTELGKLFIKP
jgi:WD40 repeat protein